MNIIFCGTCNGKNLVSSERMANYHEDPVACRFCGNIVSGETVFDSSGSPIRRNVLDSSAFHLLVIDDDKFYLELSRSILGRDYTVSVASSGAEGLDVAETIQPDLILLDADMPDMDGYETCIRFKNTPSLWHIPIFFVTAKSEGENVFKGFQLGAADYICKPLQLNVLHARIDLQIRVKQLLELTR